MNPIFNWNLDDLSKNQKMIANFIENELKRISYMTEQDIADELHISIASVSRFWKAVGYKNLKDFKISIVENHNISPESKMHNLITRVEGEDLPTNMLDLSMKYLKETSLKLSREEFYRAIRTICDARHIYVFAPGLAHGLGELLQFRLRRFGVSIHLVDTGSNALFETFIHLNSEDVVILFNFSSTSAETRIILDYAKQVNFQTILITDFIVSEAIEEADIVLYSYRGQMWEFHSMVAPTVLVESLIVGVGMENQEASLEKLENLHKLRKKYTSRMT